MVFARSTRRVLVEQVLKDLIDARPKQPAGRRRRSLPIPRSASKSAAPRASTESWLNIHRTAHGLGLHSERDHALRPYRQAAPPHIDHLVRLPQNFKTRPAGSRTFIPAGLPPSITPPTGPHSQAIRIDGPEGHGDQPHDARQFPTHQSVLGDAGAEDGPDCPVVWGRRPRRSQGRARKDLP